VVDENLIKSPRKIVNAGTSSKLFEVLVALEEVHFILQMLIDWFVRVNITLRTVLNSDPTKLEFVVLVVQDLANVFLCSLIDNIDFGQNTNCSVTIGVDSRRRIERVGCCQIGISCRNS